MNIKKRKGKVSVNLMPVTPSVAAAAAQLCGCGDAVVRTCFRMAAEAGRLCLGQ